MLVDKFFDKDDSIKQRNYVQKKETILIIHNLEWSESHPSQGADCRKGRLEPFSLVVRWWESGPGQWWDSLWGALPGTCWSDGPHYCSIALFVSFHPTKQPTSRPFHSSSPRQSLDTPSPFVSFRTLDHREDYSSDPLWSFGTVASHRGWGHAGSCRTRANSDFSMRRFLHRRFPLM